MDSIGVAIEIGDLPPGVDPRELEVHGVVLRHEAGKATYLVGREDIKRDVVTPDPAALFAPREVHHQPLKFDHQPSLLCPFCGFEYVHLNVVNIGARGEDEPAYLITVDAVQAKVQESPSFSEPLSARRQWIELVVDCEGCTGGSIVLAQHKGQTLVSTRPTSS